MIIALTCAVLLAGCNETAQQSGSTPTTTTQATTTPAAGDAAAPATGGKVHKLASGLQYEDMVVGSGKMADPGMNVSVHYTGWLTDGTKFDSSVDRGQPFQFQLGAGQVIRGWDEGVKGMRIGGKRKLTIPPDMGYGANGTGGVIPPNATLVFDVELLDVK
ncbi:MAG: FKBP-type peptidyl-prolyl cis-trans isomerase [Candidatus Eisenbacteria bacterium]|nr:FKBP-type peptidyl-prolyl cis-trans isomerase [Candidatus Eisenbacteria bacterium]